MRFAFNPRKSVPKKYREVIAITMNKFYFDMEQWKIYFLHCENLGISWQNLIREVLYEKITEDFKLFQVALKDRKEKEFRPFAQYNLNIQAERHFNKDFKAEKITILAQFQEFYDKIKKPVNPSLVWQNRHKHGITSDKMFEDVLAQLVEEGHIDEIENDYAGKIYYTYIPVVQIRRKSNRRFSKSNDNPFYESDIERMEKAKQNLKDGTTVRVKRKRGDKE